jgi:acetylornithine deacetylase/succinyl-diaminopimelate desuccinylase-like protein
MKGSLAAFLAALYQVRQSIKTDNLMLLIYVDEEYDFKGIRRFVTSKEAGIVPTLTLSLDGELAVATGCRGLIEISFTSKGKSGHAANPQNGINAITETTAALQKVSQELAAFADADLGQTTTNVAAIQGGVLQDAKGRVVWLRDGNSIPDTAEVVFEVRPATSQVTAEFVLQKIQSALERRSVRLANSSVRHNITPWPVRHNKSVHELLQKSYTKAGVPFQTSDRKLQGYIDAQMVAEKITAPTYIIGAGGNSKHGTNENVPLANLDAATKIYAALLQEILA